MLDISNINLPLKLRQSIKSEQVSKNKKRLGLSISERRECIIKRIKFSHWEIDTVIDRKAKDEETLLTLTERLTRKDISKKILGKNTAAVIYTINTLIAKAVPHLTIVFKGIISENGSAFQN